MAERPTPTTEADQILGQFYFALGAGADHHWLSRGASGHVRDTFLPYIERALAGGKKWEPAAPWVLHYMETIGRVAATLSAGVGRHAISKADVEQAIEQVYYDYTLNVRGDVGPWCGSDD